MARSMRSN